MGILRGFCTHVWKAALGNNCCMQHAISGTFPPQQSCSSIFLDLVIQNSHFLLYLDLYTVFYFHFCFRSILWHWAKLFNVCLLFPLSLCVHHVLSGTVLNGKKEHLIVNMWILDQDDLSICSCTTEEGSTVRASQSDVLLKWLWEVVWRCSLPRSGHWMTMIFCQWQKMLCSVSG